MPRNAQISQLRRPSCYLRSRPASRAYRRLRVRSVESGYHRVMPPWRTWPPIAVNAADSAVAAAALDACQMKLNPGGEVKVSSPCRMIGSCGLFLYRRSGPPPLFTYFHVVPTRSASPGTRPDSMNLVAVPVRGRDGRACLRTGGRRG